MRRREFIARLAATVASPSAGRAQQNKVWRVGWLDAGSTPRGDNLEVFRQGLKELGYAEGVDMVIEQRFAGGNIDRLPVPFARLSPSDPVPFVHRLRPT
jgi:putative tryptophan/tyrosine transport system substrate-binding protein